MLMMLVIFAFGVKNFRAATYSSPGTDKNDCADATFNGGNSRPLLMCECMHSAAVGSQLNAAEKGELDTLSTGTATYDGGSAGNPITGTTMNAKGCFVSTNNQRVYWNNHITGSKQQSHSPICKEKGKTVKSKDCPAYETTGTSTNDCSVTGFEDGQWEKLKECECPNKAAVWSQLTSGEKSGLNFLGRGTVTKGDEAAMDDAISPTGCVIMTNMKVQFNKNAGASGNGMYPICKKKGSTVKSGGACTATAAASSPPPSPPPSPSPPPYPPGQAPCSGWCNPHTCHSWQCSGCGAPLCDRTGAEPCKGWCSAYTCDQQDCAGCSLCSASTCSSFCLGTWACGFTVGPLSCSGCAFCKAA